MASNVCCVYPVVLAVGAHEANEDCLRRGNSESGWASQNSLSVRSEMIRMESYAAPEMGARGRSEVCGQRYMAGRAGDDHPTQAPRNAL